MDVHRVSSADFHEVDLAIRKVHVAEFRGKGFEGFGAPVWIDVFHRFRVSIITNKKKACLLDNNRQAL